MKTLKLFKVEIIFVTLLILFVGWLVSSGIKRGAEREVKKEEQETFINECVKSGGKLETVGSWWSNSYIVCYPKEQQ